MPCTWVRTIFRNPGFFTLSITNTGSNWSQCWLDAACSFYWQKRSENYAQGNYSSAFAGFYSMITKIGGLQGEEQPYYKMCASDLCTFPSQHLLLKLLLTASYSRHEIRVGYTSSRSYSVRHCCPNTTTNVMDQQIPANATETNFH